MSEEFVGLITVWVYRCSEISCAMLIESVVF